MKNYLIIFGLFFITLSCSAQQHAEVKLKNGMTFKGELLRVSQGKLVVLKSTWRDSLVLNWEDISYLDLALPDPNGPYKKNAKPHFDFSDSTLFGTFETRFGGGQQDWGSRVILPGFKVGVGTYINKNRYLALSGNVGIDFMYNLRSDLVPVGLSLRGNFREGGLTGFYDLGVGYSFASPNSSWTPLIEKNGGAYINPSIGVISKKRQHIATYFKVGYNYTSYGEKFTEQTWQQGGGWGEVLVRRQYDIQSIRLSLGLYFD